MSGRRRRAVALLAARTVAATGCEYLLMARESRDTGAGGMATVPEESVAVATA